MDTSKLGDNVLPQKILLRTKKQMDTGERQKKMYSLCPCGSGKKFRFCCRGKNIKEG